MGVPLPRAQRPLVYISWRTSVLAGPYPLAGPLHGSRLTAPATAADGLAAVLGRVLADESHACMRTHTRARHFAN